MAAAPTLVVDRVPIAELELLPGNPRRGDVAAVMASLERFGQRTPIVCNRPGSVVLKGNHTVMAARELGWDELDAVWVELDDVQAKAYALADNRTSELGTIDAGDLVAMLAAVADVDETLAHAAGYSTEDLANLLAPPRGEDESGTLLALQDVTLGDPEAGVRKGERWRLGDHVLYCANPMFEWSAFAGELAEGDVLACYPTPGVTLVELPEKVKRLVLVQPDPWMASHMVDKYRAVHGEESAWKDA